MTENISEQTQQQKEELLARVKAFNDELTPLLAKYKLGIGAAPLILLDGRVAARPHVFDDSKSEGQPTQVEPKTELEPPGEKVEGGLAQG